MTKLVERDHRVPPGAAAGPGHDPAAETAPGNVGAGVLDTGREVLDGSPEVVCDLGSPAATDADLAGSKAAALARSRAAGLPVLPGFVVTTGAVRRPEAGPGRAVLADGVDGRLEPAWRSLGGEHLPLAVRSSSPVEDTATSSMAGRFTTVLDVTSWPAFLDAVATVLASAGTEPMAVLVQPMVQASVGGVLFGVDPVTGGDRLVVEWVDGNPEPIVSGRVSGRRTTLSRRGRRLGGPALPRRLRRRLARLAGAARALHDGPQDIEWAADERGLWLLQTRPVTATGGLVGRGPRLGAGPVAETFPVPLSRLEADLWLPPLRDAVRVALVLTGAAGPRRLAGSPIVTTVGGWAVADLDLLEGERPAGIRRLDPRPAARRLGAAWRVGRLRLALPTLVDRLLADTDRQLADVGDLAGLGDEVLLRVLDRCDTALRAVHAHEVLAGSLLDEEGGSLAGAALRAVAAARAGEPGTTDAEIVARRPEVLALVAPRIPPSPAHFGPTSPAAEPPGPHDPPNRRESLRLRVRWLQELESRVAVELAGRLGRRAAQGSAPPSAPGELVSLLGRTELTDAVRHDRLPDDLAARSRPLAPAPPPVFRLADDGRPVALSRPAGDGGTGAGGGRGSGPVGDGIGSVLVVATLDPALAGQLPGRAGLVAEAGSVLAHLAILARELGIPTVVGVPGAVERFPAGSRLLVDGDTGEVRALADGPTRPDGAIDLRDVP
ncbi:MAG: PEP/pyruvate-binding domain-containing protein [Acidimicrobiia bacterium]